MEWWMRSCEEEFDPIKILSQGLKLIAVVKTTKEIDTMKVNLVQIRMGDEGWCDGSEEEDDVSLVGSFGGDSVFELVMGVGGLNSSSFCIRSMFRDFLYIGLTEVLGFLDNLEEGFEDDMRSKD
ncbi:hypothetical protein Tco_0905996 [Tanacetum coccineum]